MQYRQLLRTLGPPVAGVLSAGIVLAAFLAFERAETQRHRQEAKVDVRDRLSSIRDRIEGALTKPLHLAHGLRTHVSSNPDIDQIEFEGMAELLISQHTGILSLSLVKDSEISHIYPVDENEAVQDKHLLKLPEQDDAVERAVQTRDAWLTGPVDLPQGGTAFINRAPIFEASPGAPPESGRYWGLVSIVIDGRKVHQEIAQHEEDAGIELAIREKSRPDAEGDTFYGSDSIHQRDPIYLEIKLARGSWQLAAVPDGGWPKRAPSSWILQLGGVVLALLSGLLVFQVLRLNIRYRQARQVAIDASRAKSVFLANMSHELRTPMNAIIGMTELVLDSELTDSQRKYLEMVQQSGDSLLTLINDILDFSKIEAGKLDLEELTFSLQERVGDVMKSLALRAHGEGLELACRIHPDTPDALVGDPARLGQVIVNLVGNAIKFTDRGEVVAEVLAESQTDHEAVLHFSVSDTGVGISEDKLASMFEAFTQADISTTREYGGTGLGLAICKRLVELMDGRIWAESKVGEGSTFHFSARFKLATSKPAGFARIEPEFVQGIRVLIVDDHATNRLILEEMARNWGMLPTAASSAREALDAMRLAQQAGEPYRLLLSDVNMPEADGITLTEWIRQDSELADTTVIVLTSGARLEDLNRCEELGVAAHLMKPVKQSELLDAIGMSLGIAISEDEGEATVRREPEPEPQLRSLRFLLAEDSLVNQKLAVALLEKHGHTVTVTNNGKEAIAALASQPFDVVLMDVEMPEMGGFEATAVIRVQEKQRDTHIPIIAMTAHAMKGDRERCLDAGMDDCVAKPIRAAQLFQAIHAVVGKGP